MLGNPILNYVSFQATNNQINLDILSFVCILVAHQIDSRLLAQYLIDFLRISLLIMKSLLPMYIYCLNHYVLLFVIMTPIQKKNFVN